MSVTTSNQTKSPFKGRYSLVEPPIRATVKGHVRDDRIHDSRIPLEFRKTAYLELKRYAYGGTFSCWFDNDSDRCGENMYSSDGISASPEKDGQEDAINTRTHGRKQTYVSIEGSIGVGKTHLTEDLARSLQIKRPNEPVFMLEEKVNLEWLGAFIENPSKRAALFQIKRLMETINAVKEMWAKLIVHREYGTTSHCIGDRLPLGNFAFAMLHHSIGNIDPVEFSLYGSALADGGPYNYPDIVLLLCRPEKALERIRLRNRRGESTYTVEYLQHLDEANLFTLLYIWYTGVVRVVPFHWDSFGTADQVLSVMNTLSWDALKDGIYGNTVSILREEIRVSLLYMPYSRMREVVYQLADIVKSI